MSPTSDRIVNLPVIQPSIPDFKKGEGEPNPLADHLHTLPETNSEV